PAVRGADKPGLRPMTLGRVDAMRRCRTPHAKAVRRADRVDDRGGHAGVHRVRDHARFGCESVTLHPDIVYASGSDRAMTQSYVTLCIPMYSYVHRRQVSVSALPGSVEWRPSTRPRPSGSVPQRRLPAFLGC